MTRDDQVFRDWIRTLNEDVILGEYGYEEGEFTVYPDHWRPMFDEGLTPAQAFRRALDAYAEARREEDAAQAANWARIQAEDAAAIARQAALRAQASTPTPRVDSQAPYDGKDVM